MSILNFLLCRLSSELDELERQRLGQQSKESDVCVKRCLIKPLELLIRQNFAVKLTPYSAIEGLDFALFSNMQEAGIPNYIRIKYEKSFDATLNMVPFEQLVYLLLVLSTIDLTLFKFVVKHELCGARAELLRNSNACVSAQSRLYRSYPLHVHFVRGKWYSNGPSRYAQTSFLRYYEQLSNASLNDYALIEMCLRGLKNVFALHTLPINTPFIHIKAISKRAVPIYQNRFSHYFTLSYISHVPVELWTTLLYGGGNIVMIDFREIVQHNSGALRLMSRDERNWFAIQSSQCNYNPGGIRRYHLLKQSPAIVAVGSNILIELRRNEELRGHFMLCNVSIENANLFRLTRNDCLLVQHSGQIYILNLLRSNFEFVQSVPDGLIFCQFCDDSSYVCYEAEIGRYVRHSLPVPKSSSSSKTFLFRGAQFKGARAHMISEYLRMRHVTAEALQFFQTREDVFFSLKGPLVGGHIGQNRIFVDSEFLLIFNK